ncbi:acyl-coenzyme A thioesterase 9, mitochondrial isoform X2 [Drosophila kikkawai]|uniref:Acyl-coenzyme A thioesterase 9, mitochondrial isoform X2 n=1 Tax=Drosophila kikkawai TaxID=30033 RepID=A0A6P4IB27_DROKI|nr:acyl-coenzyme A thioesterase 9, mitochondrial isoform X2 [Drosophila kikkawai]
MRRETTGFWAPFRVHGRRTVAKKIQEHLGVESGYHTIPKSRDDLLKFHPQQEDLPERSMKDSHTTALVDLKSDPLMRQLFVNGSGFLRMGKIMEQLDLIAVWICHRHVYLPKLPKGVPLPYTFVTLFIDHAKFLVQKFKPDVDLQFTGSVSWTGQSSMEVTTYVRQNEEALARAIFIVGGRNATNSGPAPINPLKPQNELEECFHSGALERQGRREKRKQGSSSLLQPTREEEKVMYDLFLRTKGSDGATADGCLPPDCRWISDWHRSTILHPFPESRNASNTIFSGFIIRNATETSYIAASLYGGSYAVIQFISDVTFTQQIPVHSFMKTTAYIVYTHGKYIQLMTAVKSLDAVNFTEVHTNALHLTYKVDRPVPEIMPSSFHEALWYLEGRRHFETFLKSLEGDNSKEGHCV